MGGAYFEAFWATMENFETNQSRTGHDPHRSRIWSFRGPNRKQKLRSTQECLGIFPGKEQDQRWIIKFSRTEALPFFEKHSWYVFSSVKFWKISGKDPQERLWAYIRENGKANYSKINRNTQSSFLVFDRIDERMFFCPVCVEISIKTTGLSFDSLPEIMWSEDYIYRRTQ